MPTPTPHPPLIIAAAMIFLMSLISIGCDSGNIASNGNLTGANKKPTFTFHKPAEFEDATLRIRELHDAINGADALPAPIEYQVQEIVHGTGASGHSHYFLYDPNDDQEHDFGEEEHHETTDQIIIDVKVDAFKELSDVVRWLPKIASNGDMNESDWVQVNEISKELSPELLTILETQKDDEQRRTSYREKADSFELQISKLEKLVR